MALFKKKILPSTQAYAVVTGAGSGIGRSFALEIGRRGGAVVCADIDLNKAEETVQLLEQQGSVGFALKCDVGNVEDIRNLSELSEILLAHPVTLLINNAGVGLGGKFDEVTLEDWHWITNINQWGVVYGCHQFVPKFIQHGQGAIINVASAASFSAAPEMAAYNVTKAGVLALSETLAAELSKHNIKINVLCPTMVPTNIIKNGRLPSQYTSKLDHLFANYSMISSDEVAKLTLDRLDKGYLYTTPQIDAKIIWLTKRVFPSLYTKFLGMSYRVIR